MRNDIRKLAERAANRFIAANETWWDPRAHDELAAAIEAAIREAKPGPPEIAAEVSVEGVRWADRVTLALSAHTHRLLPTGALELLASEHDRLLREAVQGRQEHAPELRRLRAENAELKELLAQKIEGS